METPTRPRLSASEIAGGACAVFMFSLACIMFSAFILWRAWNGSLAPLGIAPEVGFRQSICLVIVAWCLGYWFRGGPGPFRSTRRD